MQLYLPARARCESSRNYVNTAFRSNYKQWRESKGDRGEEGG